MVLRDKPDDVKEIIAALDNVGGAAKYRNDMLHAMWGVITESTGFGPGKKESPPSATAVKQHGRTYAGGRVTARQIDEAAEKVALVRYELNSAFMLLSIPAASRIHEHKWPA
jgi:hypothetical protein